MTIQYRLGIFGFFSSGDSEIPGNAGFLDQRLAMQWVQDNIEAFGGDKSRVTVFGLSAGAQSVLMHLVSAQSAGLFHRAIVDSCQVTGRYRELDTYEWYYYQLARTKFNCSPGDELRCLQRLPWQSLVNDASFSVVIDGEFLVDQPRELFRAGRFHRDVDVIIGFTNDDGYHPDIVQFLIGSDILTNGIVDPIVTDHVLEVALAFTISETSNAVMNPDRAFKATRNGEVPLNHGHIKTMLRSQYTSRDALRNARLLLDAQRDAWYVAFSLWTAAQLAARDVNVYVYSFNHRSANLGVTPAGAVQLGAPHGHQELYIFGEVMPEYLGSQQYTADETALSRVMMRTWTTFSATGSDCA